MTLQTSGAISLSDIQTEFGGANPIGLNEYYAGGGLVPSGATGTNGAVPSSGKINFWNFYGTAAAAAATYWMSMLTINSANTEDNYGQAIAADSSGNVYITGYETTQTAGYSDIFIVKYNTSGVIQWQRRLGGANDDRGSGIAVDGSGNVYITGYEASQTAGNTDIFIAKYNTSGVIQWQRRLGTSDELGSGIAVDGSGNVYITGYEATQTTGNYDVFVAKYNTSGVVQWQRRLGGTDFDYGLGIAVDGSGNVYITGYEASSQVTGNNSIFIAKYNTSGVIQWQRSLGGTNYDQGSGIAVDGSGNVYITGYGTSQTAGGNDIIIAKYNTSGVIQWQRRLGGTSDDSGSGIAVDGSGNVYITGSETSQTAGVNDIIIAKYNTSGVIQWQRRVYSSSHVLYGTSIVVNGTTFSVCGYYNSVSTNQSHASSNSFSASLPIDGTKTGSSVTFSQVYATPVLQYAATTLTDAATTLTDAATTLTDAATTLTAATTTLTDATTTYTAETHTI
jgi:uncharacterized delta-60 repeat protein